MQKTISSIQNLSDFFYSWSALSQIAPIEERMHDFFVQLKNVIRYNNTLLRKKHILYDNFDCVAMGVFFKDLQAPLALNKKDGFFCNPWTVAKLNRDEVRNSSVLAWWLDPNGTHGLADAFLLGLLHEVSKKELVGLKCAVSPRCRVRLESCPDGNHASRVDIEVDDPSFYLIIEVKIDAQERNDQLTRYCDIAKKRSRNRPWAIIFLTPQGRDARGQCENTNLSIIRREPIVPFSWKEISIILNKVSRQHTEQFDNNTFQRCEFVRLLARSFCHHILKF